MSTRTLRLVYILLVINAIHHHTTPMNTYLDAIASLFITGCLIFMSNELYELGKSSGRLELAKELLEDAKRFEQQEQECNERNNFKPPQS